MRRLRRSVRDHDIFRWVDSFLDAAIAKSLEHFERREEGEEISEEVLTE